MWKLPLQRKQDMKIMEGWFQVDVHDPICSHFSRRSGNFCHDRLPTIWPNILDHFASKRTLSLETDRILFVSTNKQLENLNSSEKKVAVEDCRTFSDIIRPRIHQAGITCKQQRRLFHGLKNVDSSMLCSSGHGMIMFDLYTITLYMTFLPWETFSDSLFDSAIHYKKWWFWESVYYDVCSAKVRTKHENMLYQLYHISYFKYNYPPYTWLNWYWD